MRERTIVASTNVKPQSSRFWGMVIDVERRCARFWISSKSRPDALCDIGSIVRTRGFLRRAMPRRAAVFVSSGRGPLGAKSTLSRANANGSAPAIHAKASGFGGPGAGQRRAFAVRRFGAGRGAFVARRARCFCAAALMITEPFALASRRTFASFNAAAINTSISARSKSATEFITT